MVQASHPTGIDPILLALLVVVSLVRTCDPGTTSQHNDHTIPEHAGMHADWIAYQLLLLLTVWMAVVDQPVLLEQEGGAVASPI